MHDDENWLLVQCQKLLHFQINIFSLSLSRSLTHLLRVHLVYIRWLHHSTSLPFYSAAVINFIVAFHRRFGRFGFQMEYISYLFVSIHFILCSLDFDLNDIRRSWKELTYCNVLCVTLGNDDKCCRKANFHCSLLI